MALKDQLVLTTTELQNAVAAIEKEIGDCKKKRRNKRQHAPSPTSSESKDEGEDGTSHGIVIECEMEDCIEVA